ncbi:hypothetical protein OHC33_002632 [Knufia fluminis]|uniref:BPL/LPL catalytic domain-containing protein n=1 Tax=Knufia fluminis TaxID=191047 RepID=A0AAN8I7K7_9EURO|nr:hypothetical protein OHC33_002632 [Knufia fluminis]
MSIYLFSVAAFCACATLAVIEHAGQIPGALSGESLTNLSMYAIQQLDARDLLLERQSTCYSPNIYCPVGGYCCYAEQNCCPGGCAPADASTCCGSTGYCHTGFGCCQQQSCTPLDAECCSDGGYCPDPFMCVKVLETGQIGCCTDLSCSVYLSSSQTVTYTPSTRAAATTTRAVATTTEYTGYDYTQTDYDYTETDYYSSYRTWSTTYYLYYFYYYYTVSYSPSTFTTRESTSVDRTTTSLRLQEALLERHFADKAALRRDASLNSVAPPPTLLTFQTHPTYTVGRRHLNANPLSSAQISFLTGNNVVEAGGSSEAENSASTGTSLATFYPSPRGGLLTYHAPGQLTAYLVCNLRTHNLTPRCYIRMLENTVMRTCARHNVPNVTTTEDPGVWIAEGAGQSIQELAEVTACPKDSTELLAGMTPTNRKICAIGVQVSRGVTSHGIGLNVFDAPIQGFAGSKQMYTLPRNNVYTQEAQLQPEELSSTTAPEEGTVPAPGYLSWGFSRIVACGLEGKSVTWLSREQQRIQNDEAQQTGHSTQPLGDPTLRNVADSLAIEVARSLKIEVGNIDQITQDDIVDVERPTWETLRNASDNINENPREMNIGTQYHFRDLRQDTGMRILG